MEGEIVDLVVQFVVQIISQVVVAKIPIFYTSFVKMDSPIDQREIIQCDTTRNVPRGCKYLIRTDNKSAKTYHVKLKRQTQKLPKTTNKST